MIVGFSGVRFVKTFSVDQVTKQEYLMLSAKPLRSMRSVDMRIKNKI